MLSAIILAAGKGTRMLSETPKALQTLCGVPLVGWVLAKAKRVGCQKICVVTGYRSKEVSRFLGDTVQTVEQKKQLGSGHAVQQAAVKFKGFRGSVFVFYCDTPLLADDTLKRLWHDHKTNDTDCSLLSVTSQNPKGYGRIKRNNLGQVEKIVEENDATPDEKNIAEINVGCYVFDSKKLFDALTEIKKSPIKKEYYLTDVIEILSKQGRVGAVQARTETETLGINTRSDLARLEALMQENILTEWAEKGVRIRDARTTTIDGDVKIGRGTTVLPHTVIEEGSVIGEHAVIGPFARVRGKSRIGDHVVIGNFVEVVRSVIGDYSQVKHLSYIGDARIGSGVNVGAGTITANYDGKNKHQTVIKDKAQIGSGTILVAPVTVGREAKTGAGSVLPKGKNVPDRSVVVGVPARELKTQKSKFKTQKLKVKIQNKRKK